MKKNFTLGLCLKYIMFKAIHLFLIICLFINLANAVDSKGQSVLEKKISIQIKNKSLEDAIKAISIVSEVDFVYVTSIFSSQEKISVTYKNEQLSVLLSELLENRGIKFEEQYDKIILSRKKTTSDKKFRSENNVNPKNIIKQENIIKGKVIGEDGVPLPGVTVLVKGTFVGTSTDFDGKFTLSLPEDGEILVFSYIGYNTQEVDIANQTEFEIVLEENLRQLEEIVVVGYGTQKKGDIIGSVSSVEGKNLNFKSAPNFESSLQGMAAGVSVQTQGGSPGAPSIIKIRGTNSINSSTDPLWVIDGMPVFSNPYGLGSSNQSPMSLINPSDIESIQVLKDAAATSIYGSRGSNGVIIVTTKGGKEGKGQTTLSYTTGVSQLTKTPEDVGYANSSDWFEIMDQTYQNSFSRDFTMNDHYIYSPQAQTFLTREQAEQINTDWFDELFRTGSFSEYNLSSSKGFEKGSFYISGNYRKDNGVQKHNDFQRASVRSNLDFQPSKNLRFGLKLNFAYTDNEKRNSGTTSIVTFALPWFPIREPDNPNRYYNAYTGGNPTATNDPKNTLNNVKQYRGLGGLSIDYTAPFLEGLSFRSEFSTDFLQSNMVAWTSKDIWLDGSQKPTARAREEVVTYGSSNFNIYPTYKKSFGDNDINVVAGFEAQRISQYSRILEGQGLTGIYQELGNPNILTDMYGGLNNERYLLGFFGRVNYKFKEKYLIGISARRDGTSAFTENHRWGNFVAFSAGWYITDEPFMDFMGDGISLKLRGSYGETGNQNVRSGLNEINYYGNVPYGSQSIQGVNGTLPINLPVEGLTWETTRSTDVGIDYGFANNRINGSLAYYSRYVDGMLLPVPVPWSAGVSSDNLYFGNGTYDYDKNSIYSNVGDLINSGFELDLHSVNVSTGNFEWVTDFNISFNKNMIKSLTPELDESGKGLIHSNTPTVSRSGYKRKVWYIADYAGVDRVTGVPMIYMVDKDHYEQTGETRRLKSSEGEDMKTYATTTNIDENRFYQEGKSADPTYYGGLSNTLKYRGFDFSFMFSFSGGNYIMDYDRQIATLPNETRMMLKEVLTESWSKRGQIAKYPQLRARGTYIIDGVAVAGFDNADVYHNRELFKGDFVRLRNVQLGYSFSPDKLKAIHIQALRLYFQGTNLWTLTDYPGFDPEGMSFVKYASTIPQVQSLIFGVEAKF